MRRLLPTTEHHSARTGAVTYFVLCPVRAPERDEPGKAHYDLEPIAQTTSKEAHEAAIRLLSGELEEQRAE